MHPDMLSDSLVLEEEIEENYEPAEEGTFKILKLQII